MPYSRDGMHDCAAVLQAASGFSQYQVLRATFFRHALRVTALPLKTSFKACRKSASKSCIVRAVTPDGWLAAWWEIFGRF